MEQNGYITRRALKKDTGRTAVEITPEGIALIDEKREQTFLRVELLLSKISKGDPETYIRIFQQIKEVLGE